MAAPTVADYQQSSWSTATTTSEVTPTVTWAAGDRILVVGFTADNGRTLATPTATGLTFTALSGSPTNTGSNTKLYMWEALAASSGSSAITSAPDVSSAMRGIAAFVFRGSDGFGTTAKGTSLTATGGSLTQSLTRVQANSRVVAMLGDWGAANDVTVTPSPTGTQRIAQFVSGQATAFLFDYGDQGATGTTGYGATGLATTSGAAWATMAVEVKGSATTHTTKTWQSSYKVTDHTSTTWQSSYVVRDHTSKDWASSYAVKHHVSPTWQSSYIVRDHVSPTWQSSYTVRHHASPTWASSYIVRDHVTPSWASSYTVRHHATATWQSSYGVKHHLNPTWQSSYAVKHHVTSTWGTSYAVKIHPTATWASSYATKAHSALTWQSSYDVIEVGHPVQTWQSTFKVKHHATKTWQSSYDVAASASEWPDATNTGWEPTGVTLTTVGHGDSGPGWDVDTVAGADVFYIRDDNTVIDGLEIPFVVKVLAHNVTITRSRIAAASFYTINTSDPPINYTGLTLEDCEIDGLGSLGAEGIAVMGTVGATYRRCNFHGFLSSGPRLASDNLMIDCWIHGFVCEGIAHSAGTSANDGGSNISIIHNNVDIATGAEGCASAAIEIAEDFGFYDGVLIQNNLVNGGAYEMFVAQSLGHSINIRVEDNHFGRDYYPNGGQFGPIAQVEIDPVKGNTFSGNVWADTLELLPGQDGASHTTKTWRSSYKVKDHTSKTWQSGYVVHIGTHVTSTWQSSYKTADHQTKAWRSSYAVAGPAHVTATWQSSYSVLSTSTTAPSGTIGLVVRHPATDVDYRHPSVQHDLRRASIDLEIR